MKKPVKVSANKKPQSLIKVAQSDAAFKLWARNSGIATSGEIDVMPKANLMRLYRSYLKELKGDSSRMIDDMRGMVKN